MAEYYVNNRQQKTGEREVHKEKCRFFPSDHTYLGVFSHCQDAVKEAKRHYDNVDACAYCCEECHKK